jgi:hypothetical protein
VKLSDGSATVAATFFNQPWLAEQLAPGVRMQQTGGHSPGHAIVRVSGGETDMVLLGHRPGGRKPGAGFEPAPVDPGAKLPIGLPVDIKLDDTDQGSKLTDARKEIDTNASTAFKKSFSR